MLIAGSARQTIANMQRQKMFFPWMTIAGMGRVSPMSQFVMALGFIELFVTQCALQPMFKLLVFQLALLGIPSLTQIKY